MYDKGNYKEMTKYPMQAININTSDDTDISWHATKTNIAKAMKNFIPTIDLHCNMVKGNTPSCKEIIARVKNKKRCWQRYLETKEPQKYKEHCRVTNQVRRMTRKAKMSYENDIVSNGKSNPKFFCSYARQIFVVDKAFHIFKLAFVVMMTKVYFQPQILKKCK